MRIRARMVSGLMMLLAWQAAPAHGPVPESLQRAPVPAVPGLVDGPDPIVIDRQAAIALGKALFWDINVGSDGMACGSCHFHAGADVRTRNQMNPGAKGSAASSQTFANLPSGPGSGGPNYTLRAADFPLYRYNNPLDKNSGVSFATDDVVASAGTFSGQFTGTSRFSGANDVCARAADPVFHVNSVGTRRVEPRNAPTVINAVFNHRLFWDGRASNIFNGSSGGGERDPNAGVWIKSGARSVTRQRLHLQNSALASLATEPPLSDAEMACQQRSWPDIGRKLLTRQPLASQQVHFQDSVLAPFSQSSAAALRPGLNLTYKNLVTRAFSPKYWSYSGTGPFGAAPGSTPYTQMEANFAMFFGLALQLYQSTLVSDQAPIDITTRDAAHKPTWAGMGKSPEELAALSNGFNTYVANHCNLCHAGPTMTTAAIALHGELMTPVPGKVYGATAFPVAFGPNALGPEKAGDASGINQYANLLTRDLTAGGARLIDMGFANTGVARPDNDPGLGGADRFDANLAFADQYVQYLLGNNAGILEPAIRHTRSCDFLLALVLSDFQEPIAGVFTAADGMEPDGSREGLLRDQNCITPESKYIPTVAAANTARVNAPEKLAVSKHAVFKIPGLRNIELTGPYMHNGSMATLEQVIEFYARFGNVDNPEKHSLIDSMALTSTGAGPKQRADLVAFLKTFTDERVRFERAPFDHPQLPIPNGHPSDQTTVSGGNSLGANLAADAMLVIPAVGANGAGQGLRSFDQLLTP